MASPHQARLLTLLRSSGPAKAGDLANALGVSQPTVSRALATLPQVVAIGRARATRYALAHDIGREGSRWPLYRLDAQAQPQQLGWLQALHGDRFHVEPLRPLPAFLHGEFADGLFPSLPWFLDDQRPQGFLGRAFARQVAADIGATPDLALWRSDDIVLALLRHGDDVPGDLILGDAALTRAMQAVLDPPEVIDQSHALQAYAERAEDALRGEVVGSSAGGEQPKFTATLRDGDGRLHRTIVKFSERTHLPAGQRWADLLYCEHLAGEVLRAHGLPAAITHITRADGRVFLQSERFDRTDAGGRRGFVSLAALDAAYYGHGRIDWWTFAPLLRKDRWLDAEDAQHLALFGWFGALIGNNDMHLGNAGLLLADARPLALAPCYDMLPMLWRPSAHGELVARDFTVPLPTPQHLPAWRKAAVMALDFWQRVMEGAGISTDMRSIAVDTHRRVARAVETFG